MTLLKHRDRLPLARDWPLAAFPTWRWFDDRSWDDEGHLPIKVEEFAEDGTLVIRAEMPGIDPEKDVEITVEGGMLHITAERTEEEEKKERSFYRRELRYGSFARSIPLPDGVDESAVSAAYKDGVLEVRVPLPVEPEKEGAVKVPVTKG